MTTLDRTRILLSAQRALLGAISPDLRAVDITWSNEEIRIRFTVDGTDDYDMDDLVNSVEAEMEADFLPDVRVSSEVMLRPDGNPIPIFDELAGGSARVFARSES